jgi:hypothetical protein
MAGGQTRWGRAAGALGGAIALMALAAMSADAKATYESPYGYDRTWNAALRFVRVDNGWKITEKDEASGYLLFDYVSPENVKPAPASLELVRAPGDGATSVVVQIARMPRYHEQALLDELSAKMRREYGEPPPPRPRAPEPAPDDAGTGDQG